MRKWFLCFHPGNGCISMAGAAAYHYVNITRAPIFYVLSVHAWSLLQLQCFLLKFNWACSLLKGRLKKWTVFFQKCFWDSFLTKGQTFSFWNIIDFMWFPWTNSKNKYCQLLDPDMQRMSLLGVDSFKLCVTWGNVSPGDLCNGDGCGPTNTAWSVEVVLSFWSEIQLSLLSHLWRRQMWYSTGCLDVLSTVTKPSVLWSQWFACCSWVLSLQVMWVLTIFLWGTAFPSEMLLFEGIKLNESAQVCIFLGVFMAHRQAKPWVNPAIYWFLLDLVEMLWSQDLTGQGENLNTNEIENRDPRVSYL